MAADQTPVSSVLPSLQRLYTSTIQVDRPLILGHSPYGERRIINIKGGTFSGDMLSGRVLPGGADWQIIRNDSSSRTFLFPMVSQSKSGAIPMTRITES